MQVLGIDPGTATTGYGLVCETESGGIQIVDYGIIATPKNTPAECRLLTIFEKTLELIALHSPDTAAVEKLFFQRNVTTALAVGQARGVVLLALAKNKIPIFEYTPMEVKLAVAGYGGADKKQVQLMVKAILNMNDIPRPDDAADALAIAICHCQSYRLRQFEERQL